jgi:hypothetical protein
MIVKKEKKGELTVYYVDKDYDNNKLKKVLNKKLRTFLFSLLFNLIIYFY